MYNTGIDARHIIKEKRAAQSSILYSMRALAALTFKLKGAKEVIAKNDPTLHLLRISQINQIQIFVRTKLMSILKVWSKLRNTILLLFKNFKL